MRLVQIQIERRKAHFEQEYSCIKTYMNARKLTIIEAQFLRNLYIRRRPQAYKDDTENDQRNTNSIMGLHQSRRVFKV